MRYKDVRELSYELVEQVRTRYKGHGWLGKKPDPDRPLFDWERVERAIKGAIDTHVLPGPDAYIVRPLDDIDIAIQACEMGMGGVVYKGIFGDTARSARLAQKVVEQWAKERGKESPRIIGGMVLGYPVGGLNPEAVRWNAKVGGKFVWTPVNDSSHTRKLWGVPGGIEVIGKDDKVVPELREIFGIIAKYDLVLALSHHSTRERFIMIDDAREAGVKRILIVHATESIVKMSVEQMKTAADKGAYLELCCLDFNPNELIWDEWLEAIKEVGADHIILATDAGNYRVGVPAVQYRALLGRLLELGVSDADLEKMAKTNPRNLIF